MKVRRRAIRRKRLSFSRPGFGGDLVDTPTCPIAHFCHEECPIDTQIGVATTVFEEFPSNPGGATNTVPVYNLAAEPGDVAKIGFPFLAASLMCRPM